MSELKLGGIENAQTNENEQEGELLTSKPSVDLSNGSDNKMPSGGLVVNDDGTTRIDIHSAGSKSFLDYAGFVITQRALPDVRDGLKPVHRRILYAMDQLHVGHNKMTKKSARIVGDVIGKYHPHGDTSVYEAMVRMAQDFSMRIPLVDGQGNFGSIDGDNAAAMRYTEARMSAASESCFDDIHLDTVDYIDNYDGTVQEPVVLPLSYPNLLINGVEGIAVGMATYVPPHNPVEVMSAVQYMIQQELDGNDPVVAELMKLVPAPDFPTGGLIHGLGANYESAWENGSGKIYLRSKWHEETLGRRRAIVITEIPYQVNKTTLIEKIVTLAKPNKEKQNTIDVEGIAEIRDESNKDGIRLIIEVKSGVEPELIFNKLVKMSQMEITVSYNVTVLVKGRPRKIGLVECLEHFIDHKIDVIIRRTNTLDAKAAARLHILSALLKALVPDMLDKVIKTIRQSVDSEEANNGLQLLLDIDELQATAILDMRLQRLTGMQVGALEDEAAKLEADRLYYAEILGDIDNKQLRLAQQEITEFNERFQRLKDKKGDRYWGERRSEIAQDIGNVDLESMTTREMCGVLLSERNYIRRVPISEFGLQGRGTRGKSQFKLAEDDRILSSTQAFSHDYLLMFTEQGRVFAVKTFEVPDALKGRFVQNLIPIEGDKVIQILSIPEFNDDNLMFITENGVGKRLKLSDIDGAKRKNGIAALTIREGDRLVEVNRIGDDSHVVILSDAGKALHFDADQIRTMGRGAAGVKAMNVKDNKVVGFCVVEEGNRILAITENGRGSAFALDDFPIKNRGGMGVQSIKVTKKTGKLKRIITLPDGAEMVAVSEGGVGNRMAVDSLRSSGRGNSGVTLMSIDDDDRFGDAFTWVDEE